MIFNFLIKILSNTDFILKQKRVFFQEFYKGTGGPFSLPNFLRLIWSNDKQLAGSQQQDAHEFFMSTLNLLHQDCSYNMGKAAIGSEHARRCNCIIHQIFSGCLQSELHCQNCK